MSAARRAGMTGVSPVPTSLFGADPWPDIGPEGPPDPRSLLFGGPPCWPPGLLS